MFLTISHIKDETYKLQLLNRSFDAAHLVCNSPVHLSLINN